MADRIIHEMISAYAAGCMDKDNFDQFRNYKDSGGELPEGELGELQNLMALIPTILEPEKPDPKLKSRVAKRLMNLQGEIKEKLKQRKQTTEESRTIDKNVEAVHFGGGNSQETVSEHSTRKPESPQSPGYHPKYDYYHTQPGQAESDKPDQELPSQKAQTIQTETGKEPLFSTGNKIVLGIIAVILIGVILGFYFINKSANSRVDELKSEVETLKTEVSQANEFVADYRDLIEFFNFNNISVVDLKGTNKNPSSSGKLLISFSQKEALLKLSNMPPLRVDQVYQLWMRTEDNSYSLGTFKPTREEKYIKIKEIPYVLKEEINLFRITKEPMEGSAAPEGGTFLFGALNGEDKK
jgi:F0F1-type ATP synthase assembly protein I